jgi:hypothetical protein
MADAGINRDPLNRVHPCSHHGKPVVVATLTRPDREKPMSIKFASCPVP